MSNLLDAILGPLCALLLISIVLFTALNRLKNKKSKNLINHISKTINKDVWKIYKAIRYPKNLPNYPGIIIISNEQSPLVETNKKKIVPIFITATPNIQNTMENYRTELPKEVVIHIDLFSNELVFNFYFHDFFIIGQNLKWVQKQLIKHYKPEFNLKE
jgi:hypothetical protein